ncbi:hypothetical protein PLICRDRAFT_43075 [Plicaturopsis crispa FD-325 SS-3]|nr:hypothetical protein PLICRDRAFT_43075 [Plicaturopsis crispa FD-325 SS-3]
MAHEQDKMTVEKSNTSVKQGDMAAETDKSNRNVLEIPSPAIANQPPRKLANMGLRVFIQLLCVTTLVRLTWDASHPNFDDGALCPQAAELAPVKNGDLWAKLGATYETKDFANKAVEWLGGAVRVPTESFDIMGPVGVDPRWEAFELLHDYLLEAFPLVHSTLELTKVNTYGLVYVWKGSDASLKPVLLAAHQDVVPVDPSTVNDWAHPPYSGYFDGERIWGRGSLDDKSGLIGILAAFESLLEAEFVPTRPVILASGFDEESTGLEGAKALSTYLEKAYGENFAALLVDEGAEFSEQFGSIIAMPAIGEKGYLDTRIQVSAPGGHSSIPPAHTSIGILAALLVKLESNPIPAHLARGTPLYETVQCLAAHTAELPTEIKSAIKNSAWSDLALKRVEAYFFKDAAFKSLAGTTQAIDLVGGGVKTNALPEEAWAVVNHRIATQSSVAALKKRHSSVLAPLAEAYNLSYTAFGLQVSDDSAKAGALTVDAFGAGLEPAPISPTGGGAYALLSGTIKATYNAHRGLSGDNIAVAPGVMSGNTDTQFYWRLTENIFRYNHQNAGKGDVLDGIHTVNESLTLDSFLEMIRFFTTLILNADESTTL